MREYWRRGNLHFTVWTRDRYCLKTAFPPLFLTSRTPPQYFHSCLRRTCEDNLRPPDQRHHRGQMRALPHLTDILCHLSGRPSQLFYVDKDIKGTFGAEAAYALNPVNGTHGIIAASLIFAGPSRLLHLFHREGRRQRPAGRKKWHRSYRAGGFCWGRRSGFPARRRNPASSPSWNMLLRNR